MCISRFKKNVDFHWGPSPANPNTNTTNTGLIRMDTFLVALQKYVLLTILND